MNFLFGESINLEESFSSRGRSSNSKRGIQVTLSKQKSSQSKHENSTEKPNTHNSSVLSIGSGNESQYRQTYQADNEHLKSNETEMMRFTENRSAQSDLISSYFDKSKQKESVRKQSVVLDEQIRKLQLQIYNTRTKITQAKYLTKKQSETKLLETIKNTRKSKQKHKANELQTTSNKSLKSHTKPPLTLKACRNYEQQHVYSTYSSNVSSNKSPIQIIQNKSPKKFLKLQDRSQSPSPPHPSLLRQMLSSKKKHEPKHLNFQKYQNQILSKEVSLSQKPIFQCSYIEAIPNQKFKEKVLAQVNEQQKIYITNQKLPTSINNKISKSNDHFQPKRVNSSKKVKKENTKKRSVSAYSSHQVSTNLQNTKKNQQKIMPKSSEQFIKRKSKVSDFNIDLHMHLKNTKKTYKINISNSNLEQNNKNDKKMPKKGFFSNESLAKTYQQGPKSFSTKKMKLKDEKPKQKIKKSQKKYEQNKKQLFANLIGQSNKIHQLLNNSSHHCTIKSKYLKPKNIHH